MRDIAINTYGYIWSLPAADCIRRVAGMGYRQFELMINPIHMPLDDFPAAARRDLRQTLADCGAIATSINMPSLDHNLASPLARVRAASVAMYVAAIDIAADLDVPWLVVVPGRMNPLFPPPPALRQPWINDSIAALLPHAERRGVGLAIENVPFTPIPDAASLADFVRQFKSASIGICYDAANAHFIGEQLTEGVAEVADLLRVAHLSDTSRRVWRHDRLGLGDVPAAEFMAALDTVGFGGPCTLEIIDADIEAAIRESHDRLAALGHASARPPSGN